MVSVHKDGISPTGISVKDVLEREKHCRSMYGQPSGQMGGVGKRRTLVAVKLRSDS